MSKSLLAAWAVVLSLSANAALAGTVSEAAAARKWLAQEAVPIATVTPGADGSDLDGLTAMIGPARVASFGEATHGAREFFQLKDRVFRHLARHAGFTAFAIEANHAEAEAIDAYVKGAPGDPEALVGKLGFWTWDTEEVVDLVRWMRAWNDVHEQKLSFYGVDMQFAPTNLGLAFDYLEGVGAVGAPERSTFAAYTAAAASISAGYRATAGYSPAEGRRLRQQAEALFRYFEDNRATLIAQGDETRYLRARSGALAAAWYFLMEGPTPDRRFTALPLGYDVRDRAMADLVEAALEREGPRGRIFVWAHNAHVAKTRHVDERLTMGRFLEHDLKADYVAVGFAFDHGTFQAMPPADPATPNIAPRLSEMSVGPAPSDFSEAVLRSGPSKIYAADLRKLQRGGAAWRWFDERRPLRWTGANYSVELMAKHPPISLSQTYDVLVFVEETRRARPNASVRIRQGIDKTW